MAQFNWLYLGDNGRRYNVGVFHGDRTGHLMVMCNARIVLIDFSVRQAKDYSFFIDDELFELSVEGKPGGYAYNCSINEEADTPRNRVRKRQKRLDFRKMVALITVFAIALIGVLGFAMVNQQGEPPPLDKEILLNQQGQETVAKVFFEMLSDQNITVKYSFVADGRVRNYEKKLAIRKANGFPLVDGDEFQLRYVLKRPDIHQLDFNRPTDEQIALYFDRTVDQHAALNRRLTDRQAECQVEVAYKLGGLEALALIFNQNTPRENNPDYNELNYKKFIRDIPFQEAVEKRCRH